MKNTFLKIFTVTVLAASFFIVASWSNVAYAKTVSTKIKPPLSLAKLKNSPKGTVPAASRSEGGSADIIVGQWALEAGDKNMHGISKICFDLKVDKKNPTPLTEAHFAGAAKILVDGVALYSTVVTEEHLDGICTDYLLSTVISVPAGKKKQIDLLVSFKENAPHGATFTPTIGVKEAKPKTASANKLMVSALFINRSQGSPGGSIPAGGTNVLIGQWLVRSGVVLPEIKRFCFDFNPFPNNTVQLTHTLASAKIKLFLDSQEIYSGELDATAFDRKCTYTLLPSTYISVAPGGERKLDVYIDLGKKAPHGVRFSPFLGLEGSFPVSLAADRPLMVTNLGLKKSPISRGGSVLRGKTNVSVGEWTLQALETRIQNIKKMCFSLNVDTSSLPALTKASFTGRAKILIDGITIYSTTVTDSNIGGKCDYFTLEKPLDFVSFSSKRLELVVDISSSAPKLSRFMPFIRVEGAYPESVNGNQLVLNGLTLKVPSSSAATIPAGAVDVSVGGWTVEASAAGVANIQRICFDLKPAAKTKKPLLYGTIKILAGGRVVYTTDADESHYDGVCDEYILQSFFDVTGSLPILLLVSPAPDAPSGAKFTPILNVEGSGDAGNIPASAGQVTIE